MLFLGADSNKCLFYAVQLAKEYYESHAPKMTEAESSQSRKNFGKTYKHQETTLKKGVEWLMNLALDHDNLKKDNSSTQAGFDIDLLSKVSNFFKFYFIEMLLDTTML